jgi:acetoin utilization deacetylase AcuC-like enzyme
MKLFYSPEYLYAGTSLDTTNKAGWVADSLVRDPIPGVEVVPPSVEVTFEMATNVHGTDYVGGIWTGEPRYMADRNGVCDWTPEFARSRIAATSGVVSAALTAWQSGGVAGSMSSGLHHARFTEGRGFCTLNGLVIAANEVVRRGARRVLIVDFDAHGGGGTASLIGGSSAIEQIDVSVDAFDGYESTRNSRYVLCRGNDYIDTIRQALDSVVDPGLVDLVLYNAGVDPHEDCSTGGVRGVTSEVLAVRDAMVFDWAGSWMTPVAFVFAGGYVGSRISRDQLVDLHRQTIKSSAASSANSLHVLRLCNLTEV